tara:strand:- start:324 stop:1067 length:744 start_codon:yes stop_codon:yes gene_type:complete
MKLQKSSYFLSIIGLFLLLTQSLFQFSCARTLDSTPRSTSSNDLFNTAEFRQLSSIHQYFTRIAFGSEYNSQDTQLKRWESNIRLKITGSPTTEDQNTVRTVISELNTLLEETEIRVSIAGESESYTTKIEFIPRENFRNSLPNSNNLANGFVTVWYGSNRRIYKSHILIATDQSETRRQHVIREEITQSLGLLNDTYDYNNSIFYQGYSTVSTFSEFDRAIIALAYSDTCDTGMSLENCITSLSRN